MKQCLIVMMVHGNSQEHVHFSIGPFKSNLMAPFLIMPCFLELGLFSQTSLFLNLVILSYSVFSCMTKMLMPRYLVLYYDVTKPCCANPSLFICTLKHIDSISITREFTNMSKFIWHCLFKEALDQLFFVV